MKPISTREEWLNEATVLLGEIFEMHDMTLPPTKVSCGWPTKGAVAKRHRTIGQCFSMACSSAGVNEIFISPVLSDSIRVLDVLTHELVHAVDDNKTGHGPAFLRKARLLGLEGKATATVAGDALKATFKRLIETGLGNYPHQSLDLSKSGGKKQTTRLLKAICPECGYTVRVTKKWADQGLPLCPIDGADLKLSTGEKE